MDKSDVSAVLESFIRVVKSTLSEGDSIFIRGFGSYVIKKRAQKTARLISQDKPIVIGEHFIPSFRPSKAFVQKVKESPKVKEKYEQSIAKEDKRKNKKKA